MIVDLQMGCIFFRSSGIKNHIWVDPQDQFGPNLPSLDSGTIYDVQDGMIPCQDKDLSECRHHARPDFQPRYVYPMSMKATVGRSF